MALPLRRGRGRRALLPRKAKRGEEGLRLESLIRRLPQFCNSPRRPCRPASVRPCSVRASACLTFSLSLHLCLSISLSLSLPPSLALCLRPLAAAKVQWFRSREKGGHFFDEDPRRVEYLAHAPEWIDQRESEDEDRGGQGPGEREGGGGSCVI